jgi:hypothetical protein
MNMLSINRKIFPAISYQRLFSCSSILLEYSLKISSISSPSNNKRHRTSSSPPYHHHHSHRVNPNKTNNQTNPLRRLFQPIDIKPMVATDHFDPMASKDSYTNIGQELTGGKTLERSKRYFVLYLTKRNVFSFQVHFFVSLLIFIVATK